MVKVDDLFEVVVTVAGLGSPHPVASGWPVVFAGLGANFIVLSGQVRVEV